MDNKDFVYNGKVLETIADIFDVAVECAKKIGKKSAGEFCIAYAEYIHGLHPEMLFSDCVDRVKSNLGYYAGYYGKDIQKLMQKKYDAVHPVFGRDYWNKTIKENMITAKEKGYNIPDDFIEELH